MPWKKSDLTPNLEVASTPPTTFAPASATTALTHLKKFVEQGGLLITCEDTAQFAIDTGLAPGVSIVPHGDARVVGTVLNTVFVAQGQSDRCGIRGKLARHQRQRHGLQHQQHAGPERAGAC